MMLCHSSRLTRSMPRKMGLMPALLTSTSSLPCRASTASRNASTSGSRETSAAQTLARSPIAVAASANVASVRPDNTSVAP